MSIKACLDNTKIHLQDVVITIIKINANFYRKLWFSLSNKPNFKLILRELKIELKVIDFS